MNKSKIWWNIYGILPYSNFKSHHYHGTYKEVKEFCIYNNTKTFTWDTINFELVT